MELVRGNSGRLGAALLVMILGLAACGAQGPAGETQEPGETGTEDPGQTGGTEDPGQTGGTLVYGFAADIPTFDAPMANGVFAFIAISQVYERLAEFDYDGSVRPALAESWESSDDLVTWTFNLRKGVTFHDGTEFNADAVVATYERVMNPETSLVAAQFQAGIENVEAVDEFTVRFTSNGPNASFVEQMVAELRPVIHSPAAIESLGDDYGQNPVGTGPFRFVEWNLDRQIVLERNPDYWGDAPNIDEIIFPIVPDPQTMAIEIENGTVHMSQNFPLEQLEIFEANESLAIQREIQFQVYGFWFNSSKEPFDDVRVREALTLAVDIDEIVETLGAGFMERARGPVYNGSGIVHPTLEQPEYDPEEAQRILADLGWTPGADGVLERDGERFSITLMNTSSGAPNEREIAQAVQSYYGDIGIEVEIEELEFAAFLAERDNMEHDMAWMRIGPRPPDWALTPLDIAFSCTGNLNHGGYCNPEMDAVLDEALGTADPEARKELYFQAQEILWDEYPALYVGNPFSFILINEDLVTNYQHTSIRWWNLFGDVEIAQ